MSKGSDPQITINLDKQQRAVNKQVGGMIVWGLQSGPTKYNDALWAELLPGMERARDMITEGYDASLDPNMSEAIKTALSGKPSYDLSDEVIGKKAEGAILRPLQRVLETYIAPQMTNKFGRAGKGVSKAAAVAFGQAQGDVLSQYQEGLDKIFLDTENTRAMLAENAANRAVGVIPTAEAFAGRKVSRGNAISAALSPFQGFEENKIQAKRAEWMRVNAPEESKWLSTALDYMAQGHMTNAIQGQPGPDWLGAGAMLGSAMIMA